ncbi:MAG: tetratricopeptide repeat protein [Bacteroidales bacterium]
MDLHTISDSQRRIYKLLSDRKLKDAILELRALSAQLGEWRFTERIDALNTSYQLMLSYLKQGVKDPERDKLYRKLLAEGFVLADNMTDRAFSKESNSLYYSKKRVFQRGSDSIQNAFIRLDSELNNLSMTEFLDSEEDSKKKAAHFERQAEQEAIQLFNAIWVNYPSEPEDYDTLKEILSIGSLTVPFQSLMVSALTLSLLEWFDESKVLLLLDNAEHPEADVRARAFVGIVFVFLKYDKRALLSDKIRARLESLFDDEDTVRELHAIQMQLIRSRETERITRKINEEIFPEMMKHSISSANRTKSGDLLKDSNDFEFNPEWEEYFKDSGMIDKLQEITDLQQEGSDVLMSAFSGLKNYPFFSQISNWFIPFIPNHSEINIPGKQVSAGFSNFMDSVREGNFMCNSDKYSFTLSTLQMPESERNLLLDQFHKETEEMTQLQEDKMKESAISLLEKGSNLYIQDLYRFFKLYPRKGEFRDPFNESLSFFHLAPFSQIFQNIDSLRLIAELLFKKGFYQDALGVFEMLSEKSLSDATIYQKIGFCYQSWGEYEKAVKAYQQADIIKPDSLWTLRRMALCYRNLKQFDKALENYKRIDAIDPDNINIELNIGNCYLELKCYDEALKYYFKVDYFDPDNNRAWRSVAWTSFLGGKPEQAQRYYARILDNKPNYLDYMNAGHNELLLGNIKTAVLYYRKCVEAEGSSITTFQKVFTEDLPILIEVGVAEDDIPLIIDLALYEEENKNS